MQACNTGCWRARELEWSGAHSEVCSFARRLSAPPRLNQRLLLLQLLSRQPLPMQSAFNYSFVGHSTATSAPPTHPLMRRTNQYDMPRHHR